MWLYEPCTLGLRFYVFSVRHPKLLTLITILRNIKLGCYTFYHQLEGGNSFQNNKIKLTIFIFDKTSTTHFGVNIYSNITVDRSKLNRNRERI